MLAANVSAMRSAGFREIDLNSYYKPPQREPQLENYWNPHCV